MKILELKISNVLSFKHFDEIEDATSIQFDETLNILIGENGAGKSTALEVINFIFKRVLFRQYQLNLERFQERSTLRVEQLNRIIKSSNEDSYSGFRLEPNWDFEDQPQRIWIKVMLDEIDKKNIESILKNKDTIAEIVKTYSNQHPTIQSISNFYVEFEIELNKDSKTFSVNRKDNEPAFNYLANYNLFKQVISLHNTEIQTNEIPQLFESFTLIGGYRNYHAFNPSVSVSSSTALQQIQNIRTNEFSQSLNSSEQAEPSVFNLVRLKVAQKHFEVYGEKSNGEDSESEANNQEFLKQINARLKLVNLKVQIKLTSKSKWEYSFNFIDLIRKKPLSDVNSLSAGQKAFVHLVFEAYGRGEVKGGLVIIDEPEIHLHFQFQHEYLQVLNEINKEQKCQYILATHSESLINSNTIHSIKRFALDKMNFTQVKSPKIDTPKKTLIKILDNTRSTFAFFAKKVLLVEGETDRYFFKAFINEYAPHFKQDIAILDITGKGLYKKWKDLFESFGLEVYFIGDLDAAFGFIYPSDPPYKLHSPELAEEFKRTHPDIEKDIESKYAENIFILKHGDLEHYLNIHNKGLEQTIQFCNEDLDGSIKDTKNTKFYELRTIISKITQ